MGIFDKVKFWKREDFTIDSGPDLGSPAQQPPAYDLGAQGYNPQHQDPLAPPRPDQFSQGYPPSGFPQQDPMAQHDAFGHDVFQQGYPQQSFSQQPQAYPGTTPFPGSTAARESPQYIDHSQQAPAMSQRDVELIIAKLDAIKAELDSLHQRVRKIEQLTDTGQQQTQRRYW